MILPIHAPVAPIGTASPAGATASQAKPGEFQALLEGAIQRVATAHHQADHTVQQFLQGEQQDVHTTMLAVQRAELEFELFLQVRNKVVQAYQEIMHSQV